MEERVPDRHDGWCLDIPSPGRNPFHDPPARRPSRLPIEVLELIDAWRRDRKWSARRIALELASRGHHCCVRTIGARLHGRGSKRARHQRVGYSYLHSAIDGYQRILTEECLYAHAFYSEGERREAISVWVHHDNYHRPHAACADQPPATRVHERVDYVMTSYD
jgi:transposase InsO family protein